jgi:hypothetical protein
MKIKQAEKIPATAFGPGARLDAKTNTLYGADGHVYTDLMISYDQFCQLCDELGIARPPRPPQH